MAKCSHPDPTDLLVAVESSLVNVILSIEKNHHSGQDKTTHLPLITLRPCRSDAKENARNLLRVKFFNGTNRIEHFILYITDPEQKTDKQDGV